VTEFEIIFYLFIIYHYFLENVNFQYFFTEH